jgi:hypothetical protein
MPFKVVESVREAIPILMAIYGPTGSGKTFGGLLVAAGLAGPNGSVGMLDAEHKRGSLYSDDPDICAAMPGGKYRRVDISEPFSPSRYIEALSVMEAAGITVALIDSTTHEWSGPGGCCEIADKNKLGGMPNWAKAKIEHKKFMAYCMSSSMHILFCLRAHQKVRPVKKGDFISPDSDERYTETAVIPLGTLPDTEKNLPYECLISLRIEDETHLAYPVKVPKMLAHVFPGKKLLSKSDGEAIRLWNERAPAADQWEQTRKRARASAEEGTSAYEAFWKSLVPPARVALKELHVELKARAIEADAQTAAVSEADESVAEAPIAPLEGQQESLL